VTGIHTQDVIASTALTRQFTMIASGIPTAAIVPAINPLKI